MKLENEIRKATKRHGLLVDSITSKSYAVKAVVTLPGSSVFFEVSFDRLSQREARQFGDLLDYEVQRAEESLLAGWRFQQLRNVYPDVVWCALGVKCAHDERIVSTDFASRVYRCTRGYEHDMPQHVWDGRRLRVLCPKTHPVDCDCEGTQP